MRDGAFFKVHYALFEKPIWLKSTPEQKSILMALLSLVNFAENEWEWKGEKFIVKPGQAVTSLESIAARAGKGVTIQNVRTAIAKFENLGFLTNESTKQGRLISIINWDTYQGEKIKLTKSLTVSQQTANKQLTDDLTTKEEGIEEGKEGKKDKKDKNKTPLSPRAEVPEWINTEVWESFKQHRKEIKKPMTPKAEKLTIDQLAEFEKAGMSHIDVLNQSIRNGWQGVFELKTGSKVSPLRGKVSAATERTIQNLKDWVPGEGL